MPCYISKMKGGGHIIICGDLGEHCADCGDVSEFLCDYPVGDGKTCDRSVCKNHSKIIAPNIHYCHAHYKAFKRFEKSGGVKEYLENVKPFAQP